MEIFEQVLYMGGMASVVIAVVLLVRMFIKRFPRKYSYFLWLIVGIRLVCPLTISSSLSLFNLQFLPEQSRQIQTMAEKDVPEETVIGQDVTTGKITQEVTMAEYSTGNNKLVTAAQNSVAADGLPEKGSGENAMSGPPLETEDSSVISEVLSVLSLVWLAGIALFLLWNIYLTLRVRHRLRKAVLYRDNIYECDGIASPFVYGLFGPRIYIPFRLGEEEREYILQHEQYHIRRRDHLIKAAAFLILAVYWFHPLVWISYYCMVRDMEMSCDEYVLASMEQDIRKEYSQSLLAFATNQRRLSMELLGFGETDTRRRIRHILNFHKKGKWMGILAGVVVLAVAMVCLTNEKTEGSQKDDKGTVIASGNVNGYETKLLLGKGKKIEESSSPYNGMYQGSFVLVTYKEGEKCDEQELTAYDGGEELYFPEKFSLCVQDYDGDDKVDDFVLGQPVDNSAMAYCFYTVEENGSIMGYNVSVQETYASFGGEHEVEVSSDSSSSVEASIGIVPEASPKDVQEYIIAEKENLSLEDSQEFSPRLSVEDGIFSFASYEQDTGESRETIGMLVKKPDKPEKVEPVENQVRIGFWRPEDEDVEPVYYGDGEKLERLQELAEGLDPDHGCTKAVLKKWQKEKQTGYILSYKGNVWEVYTGGYVCFLYGKDEKEDPEKNATMYLPELCKEADRICKNELDYQRIEPSEIKDIVSAELSYKKKDGTYEKQIVKKRSKLQILEDVLSKAEDMKGSSACPFGTAVLTLQLQSGRQIQLTWADDGCRVIRINGVYYEYMDKHLSFSPYGIRALFDKIPWRSMN